MTREAAATPPTAFPSGRRLPRPPGRLHRLSNHPSRCRFLLLCLLVLVAAACTRSGSGDGPPPAPQGGDQEQLAYSPVPGGPLATMLGWQGIRDADDPQLHGRIERLVAACMRRQGFEYRPLDQAAAYRKNPALAARTILDARQYAARYGYGVATSFEGKLPQVEVEDPNERVVESLPGDRRRAYERALSGGDAGAAGAGGCRGEANARVFGAVSELRPQYEQLASRARNDPRIARAHRAWASCMASRGYRLRNPAAAQHQAVESFHRALGRALAQGDKATAPDGRVVVPLGDRELRDLRRAEIALAVADQDCRVASDLLRVWTAVHVEHERAFLARHRPVLERFLRASDG